MDGGGPPICPVFSLSPTAPFSLGLILFIISFIFLHLTPLQVLPFSLGLYVPHF